MKIKLFLKKWRTRVLSLSPARRIFFSFALVILVGSILLSLPLVQLASSKATYMDHLFTTVSMVCVTGLFTQSVASTYNGWGQLICMLLIQIGGLGILTFIGLFFIEKRRKLGYKNRQTLRDSFSFSNNKSLSRFVRSIFMTTFIIEVLGALLLMIRFIPRFGWGHGIFNAIFVSISAFCNAGFDNFGGDSMMSFQTDWLVNLTLSTLIITGGLGFMVWFDLATKAKNQSGRKTLRFHTKVVLWLTAAILILGTLTSLLTEFNNPATIGSLPFGDKVLVSFFQTVSMRTAGFASLDYTRAHPVTLFVYILQMFLGGAPGGTAGGMKITTFLVLLLLARKELLGLPHTNLGKRTISPELVQRSFGAAVIFQLTFLLGLFGIGLVTPAGQRFIYLAFEVASALGTVGVSANVTSTLNGAGLSIIMALMFIGRIGPLTLMVSLNQYQAKKADTLQYVKADLIVG
ncbi:TrkH family potassium uptake protein [Streptococcus lactarius]|uniref:Potassium transporter Trk n=1 Tax=Streptococcus lactarius TaxID=684066 RepID=A0A9X1BAX2_9STRE|nr:potassium transporter TrkG [Streptococcus lactarius]MBK4779371.1 potassium transporter Trk [Streptococcus lactarius]QUB38625.1 TrkH family potassium uptake protein [Streptococcus lactarius]